ncbi:hypothetical protein [Stenotrophomonas sp. SORGH_AS_0321]|uniref:hypothetical protein n=1 Tax=Stenotrophomonas sp. SORGH_AS_0321 TaxID=3041787 RepID=UPI002857D86E|nr:hypothetical protein [Stenotrophomonas sp. SORGH_AS_0321]MDR6094836.1 dolichol kinase [Stenotrophomonas sp. SORGH_AS_0321]
MSASDFFLNVSIWRVICVGVIGTLAVGNLAWMMRRRGVRDGFTRKLNHFGLSILSAAMLFGLPDEIFVPTSIATSLCVIIIYAWSSLSKNQYIAAVIASNVRDRDLPNGNFFVFLPLVSGQLTTYTALAIVNPLYAKIAFCAMGLGDGLAEPIGMRFGKRQYTVKDVFWRVRNTKSIEGSSAVFAVSFAACGIGLILSSSVDVVTTLALSLGFALTMTGVEATAPRGMDNMLIVGTGAAFLHFLAG